MQRPLTDPTRVASVLAVSLIALSLFGCGETTPTESEETPMPEAVAVSSTSLPSGVVGTAYSVSLVATGGDGTFTWSVSAGSPPPGLTLSASGVISGTPTTEGPSTLTIRAESGGEVGSGDVSIAVYAPLSVETTDLPAAVVEQPYSATVVASGGAEDYVWSVSSGTLPPGLSLDASVGSISGSPTAEGAEDFTVRVESADEQVVDQNFRIMVSEAASGLKPTDYCRDHSDAAVATFASAQLESAVRSALAVGAGTDLTCALLSGLEELNAGELGISDIAGIQNLVGLTFLLLDGNFGISDISWLSELTSLTEELDLSENQIEDVSPLANLTNLRDLNLATNLITDVSGLSGLTALADLNLNVNSVSDPSALASLPALVNLSIGRNGLTSLDDVAGFSTLTSLEAFDNDLTTTSGLAALLGLEILHLGANDLIDITELEQLSNLRSLTLSDNASLTDIEPLFNNAGMSAGGRVYLTGTAVDCADVDTLTALGASVISDCSGP